MALLNLPTPKYRQQIDTPEHEEALKGADGIPAACKFFAAGEGRYGYSLSDEEIITKQIVLLDVTPSLETAQKEGGFKSEREILNYLRARPELMVYVTQWPDESQPNNSVTYEYTAKEITDLNP